MCRSSGGPSRPSRAAPADTAPRAEARARTVSAPGSKPGLLFLNLREIGVVHAGLLAEGSEGQAPLTTQLLHPGAESHDKVASCIRIHYTFVEVNSTHPTANTEIATGAGHLPPSSFGGIFVGHKGRYDP